MTRALIGTSSGNNLVSEAVIIYQPPPRELRLGEEEMRQAELRRRLRLVVRGPH